MVRNIFAKAVKSKNAQKIKTIDALRIKKYTSLYIHQNRTRDFSSFLTNAMVPVEHLFDNHSFCNPEWCYSKALEDKIDEIILLKKTNGTYKTIAFTHSIKHEYENELTHNASNQ